MIYLRHCQPKRSAGESHAALQKIICWRGVHPWDRLLATLPDFSYSVDLAGEAFEVLMKTTSLQQEPCFAGSGECC